MTNEQCANVAETAWNLANELDTDFAASVALRDCAVTIKELQSRIAELESRLEIDDDHPVDGIAARDATIKYQDERIAELEKDAARYRWLLEEKTDSRYYPLSGRSVAVIEFETESSDISEAIDTAMQKD